MSYSFVEHLKWSPMDPIELCHNLSCKLCSPILLITHGLDSFQLIAIRQILNLRDLFLFTGEYVNSSGQRIKLNPIMRINYSSNANRIGMSYSSNWTVTKPTRHHPLTDWLTDKCSITRCCQISAVMSGTCFIQYSRRNYELLQSCWLQL